MVCGPRIFHKQGSADHEMQDVDPLQQENTTPRYAVESDSEDERETTTNKTVPEPVTKIAYSSAGKPVTIAIGPIAREWATGVQLGQSRGDISADGVSVSAVCP